MRHQVSFYYIWSKFNQLTKIVKIKYSLWMERVLVRTNCKNFLRWVKFILNIFDCIYTTFHSTSVRNLSMARQESDVLPLWQHKVKTILQFLRPQMSMMLIF